MRICLLGSGGREHALASKLAESPHCESLFILPGNPGTAQVGSNVAIDILDPIAIGDFLAKQDIDLLVVGPEAPLVAGIRDYLEGREDLGHLGIVGPGKDGAMLEGSKDFSKQFMLRYGVPTAAAKTFTLDSLQSGYQFLDGLEPPYVLKADGLAAGKGVIITEDLDQAKRDLLEMLSGKFGAASQQVLIEEYLHGIELSVFVLTDGEDYVLLPEAKDYKRIGEGDTGPNTGGMGAVSPVPFADAAFLEKVKKDVVVPTLKGLQAEKITYKGFIFIGLMNVAGQPKVIEYNVRMGDPETQAVLPRMDADLALLCKACAEGMMGGSEIGIKNQIATTVVLVSEGYPGIYEKGKAVSGTEASLPGQVFHAGTATQNGELVTAGGRVFGLTGLGDNLAEALDKAYKTAEAIQYQGKVYRADIGQDLMG